jgi:hypothetical protein
MKNLLKIYDLFKCKNNNTNIKQAESLSDISKVTKKVITNKKNIETILSNIIEKQKFIPSNHQAFQNIPYFKKNQVLYSQLPEQK